MIEKQKAAGVCGSFHLHGKTAETVHFQQKIAQIGDQNAGGTGNCLLV